MDIEDFKESKFGKIYKVSGPLVVAEKMSGSKMYELVKIGWDKLIGEIIKIEGDTASIQ
jgi:V-type H+-transporting ATPase subunit A